MDIQYCISCERNLRLFDKMLYCKPCNYLYYIDVDKTPLTYKERNFLGGTDNYPEIFKDQDRVFSCCEFLGYANICCGILDNNEPSSIYEYNKNQMYFDLDTMVCKYDLFGCFRGANTLFWKTSAGKIIYEIM